MFTKFSDLFPRFEQWNLVNKNFRLSIELQKTVTTPRVLKVWVSICHFISVKNISFVVQLLSKWICQEHISIPTRTAYTGKCLLELFSDIPLFNWEKETGKKWGLQSITSFDWRFLPLDSEIHIHCAPFSPDSTSLTLNVFLAHFSLCEGAYK